MAADLAKDELEWRIDLARNGDGELLAEILNRNEPIPPKLCELVGVVAGKIMLKLPGTRCSFALFRASRRRPHIDGKTAAVQAVVTAEPAPRQRPGHRSAEQRLSR